MELEIKRADRIVPEYSLTGDLLAFRTCPMQYRYYNGSSLPPSRPVQMWYGEFIHGVLEVAYRLWEEARNDHRDLPFPWPYTEVDRNTQPAPPPAGLARNDLRQFAWPVEQALIQQGKPARSRRTRYIGYERASRAINMLGPHLFGLVQAAEQRVIGTRTLVAREGGIAFRTDRYVLTGVIDVLTNMSLDAAEPSNIIRDAVRRACPDLRGDYEVVVDYKGSHRPAFDDWHWEFGNFQVQTYAWLRQRQPGAPRVAAGILLYLNELAPRGTDIPELRRQINAGLTDVLPRPGDANDYNIRAWTPGTPIRLDEEFRYRRAIRVIPIDEESIMRATGAFDETVARIEAMVVDEAEFGSINRIWEPNPEDPRTCVACDFRPFCPNPGTDEEPTDEADVDVDEP